MIDLNRYYISSTFVGASGGSDGRSGYVPRALSADELKFLRGDGTWQEVQTDLSGYLSLSGGTLTGQLNVFNSISSTQTVFASGGNSEQWNTAYTNIQSNSANYILQGGNTATTGLSVGTNTGQHLILETNNTPRITILSSGSVGIGKVPTLGALDVNGAIFSNDIVFTTSNFNTIDGIYATENGYFIVSQIQGTSGKELYLGQNLYGDDMGVYGDNDVFIAIWDWSENKYYYGGQGTGGVVVDGNTSYVGIGTASPNKQLTVVGDLSSTQTIFASAIALSAVTFTGETKTSTTSVTATDTYVKVIVEGQIKYLRLFDVI